MQNRIYTKQIIEKEGEDITLAGWVQARRDHGKLIFLDLRDKEGIAQVVISAKSDAYKNAQDIRDEWVITLRGKVQKRPENLCNPHLETGDYEVSAYDLTVINQAETLPFPINDDGYDIAEELRLQYRYIDLRRSRMAQMLRMRQQYKKEVAHFLITRGFLYVDTPILTKSTPEGARDFLVPSRMHKGKFYALPQSPQQYKQLLMVAGVEKYFQFARCFRDEDLRGDRLLEFEQLDIEMSFVDEEDILALTEELVIFISEKIFGKKIQDKPFPRLTYAQAIKQYKTDKPDLRKDKNDKDVLAYVWITDFPMFEKKDDGSIGPTHHPFTAIDDNDIQKLTGTEKDLLSIHAKQYDLVLNGFEVFGGSVRTHNPQILHMVFNALGYSDNIIQERFAHLLEAFSYGVPPHGGIAASDRWLMAMFGETSIREVVPFPTSGTGHISIMDAPTSVEAAQLTELGIKIIKERNAKK